MKWPKKEISFYNCKIVLDSLIPYNKNKDGNNNFYNSFIRVTTIELTFPRIVLAEQNTHRVFSRNTSSSRAIPVKRMRKDFCNFIPHKFPVSGKGMQPKSYFKKNSIKNFLAKFTWILAKYSAFFFSRVLELIGVHKQITNRLLEPFMWTTMIITSTKWNNYFSLRVHKDAQLEIRIPAYLAKRALRYSIPKKRHFHIPFLNKDESKFIDKIEEKINLKKSLQKEEIKKLLTLIKFSVARVARGSYLNQRKNYSNEEDLNLYSRLIESKPIHASPSESIVFSIEAFNYLSPYFKFGISKEIEKLGGNLGIGVIQYRKLIESKESEL